MKRLFLAGIILSRLSFCSDIDDGIGTKSGIKAGNDLHKDLNVKYIIRKAKASAQNAGGDKIVTSGGAGGTSSTGMGGTNVGGVNMIGSKAHNIIIIQKIKGDVTSITK